MKLISIIVPVFNEQESIEGFYRRLQSIIEKRSKEKFEILFIDDGSTDATRKAIESLIQKDPCVKLAVLSRNFGKEIALTAGIDICTGDCAIPIDVDLQDPPEVIPEMLDNWYEGSDLVNAIRSDRSQDTPMKRYTSKLFYRFFNFTSDTPIPENVGDFRLLDRKVIDALSQIGERNRFMKGLFSWVGYEQSSVYFTREERQQGTTKWNYWKLWNFALDGLTAFGSWPLKIWTYLGFAIALASGLYGAFLIFLVLITGIDVPGYASLMVVVLFFGGIQLITLGILGEYLGRIYIESKQRPLYLLKDIITQEEVKSGK